MVGKKRIRITKAEVERARTAILSSDQSKERQPKLKVERKYHDFWYGLVYCDHQGLAVIATPQDNTMILGNTEEVLKVLKEKRVNKENPKDIIRAVQQYRAEKKSQSYHSASGKTLAGVVDQPPKSHRIIFKNDPQFLGLLDSLIKKGYGVPTIQRELKVKGYNVAYATLGRWIQKRREIF